MVNTKPHILFLLSFCFSPIAHSAIPKALTLIPDLVERISPGVVNISSIQIEKHHAIRMDEFFRFWAVPKERKHTTLGSGFILDREGYLLTNNHVVANAAEVLVTLVDKRQFKAKIIGRDPKLDLALLQIRDKKRRVPKKVQPLRTGDSDRVRIGETVLAIGNPFGLQNTVTKGIISAKNRTIGLGPLDDFLQTDASINPGNSGGPLFDLNGRVIGINTVIYSRTGQSGGLGFAIPIKAALQAIPDLKKYGRVPRPFLGILGEGLTPQLKFYYGLNRSEGVFVVNLVRRGPADQAGIQQGDILARVNGKKVASRDEVERILVRLKPGKKINLVVIRRNKPVKLQVQLRELPQQLEDLSQSGGII